MMSPAPKAQHDFADFAFPLRVYWEDTDGGGVVFFANYLKYFERARTEWLRSFGFSQERMRLETNTVFVVAGTAVRYLKPARLDDLLSVTVRVADRGRVSLSVHQQAWRGDHLLAEGSVRLGCVDAGTFKPRRIPTEILERARDLSPTSDTSDTSNTSNTSTGTR